MSIIEQATKRLEELRRAGVAVPWAAAGLSEKQFSSLVREGSPEAPGTAEAPAQRVPADSTPASVVRRLEVPGHSSVRVDAEPRPAVQSRSVTLDLGMLERAGYLVPNLVRSDLALEFRHIKRPILKNARHAASAANQRGSLVMVTSAVPGEGKTFCAVNLAMSIAMEIDTSVLLVDADVVRPAVIGRLGLQADKGLLDVLTDPTLELSDVMLRTNVSKLSLLPAGTPNVHSTELLASGAMERLLEELATRYADRVVIFDAPPLLLTTEARVLASRVGQVVMVVDSARTSRADVAKAFAAVEACPNVMSILNKSPSAQKAGDYGDYY